MTNTKKGSNGGKRVKNLVLYTVNSEIFVIVFFFADAEFRENKILVK